MVIYRSLLTGVLTILVATNASIGSARLMAAGEMCPTQQCTVIDCVCCTADHPAPVVTTHAAVAAPEPATTLAFEPAPVIAVQLTADGRTSRRCPSVSVHLLNRTLLV